MTCCLGDFSDGMVRHSPGCNVEFALEAVASLEEVASGKATLPKEERDEAEKQYDGISVFHASNGWTFAVFNDCDEWDYLETVWSPSGRRMDYQQMPPILQDYQPPVETARRIWGLEP